MTMQENNLDFKSLVVFFRHFKLDSYLETCLIPLMRFHKLFSKKQKSFPLRGILYLKSCNIYQQIQRIYHKTLKQKETNLLRTNQTRKRLLEKEVVKYHSCLTAIHIIVNCTSFKVLILLLVEHVAAWVGFGEYEEILKSKILSLSTV